MKWGKIKVGDCCEVTSSKRIFFSEYVDSGVPFYRSKEIIESSNGQAISEPLFISQEKYDEIKNHFGVPQPGDMLLTSVGTIGVPYIVREKDYFYFKDGNLTWFRNFSDELDSKYLYFWVKSSEGQSVLNNTTIGSSQKALTIASLKGLEIPCPPAPVQKRIVEILAGYDDLIENNQKQIKLLEEAAQRLYKEWFVDLRFPGHETTPIVDGVPEGWKQLALEQITPILTGKKDANFSTEDGRYPFFTCAQAPLRAPSYSFDCNAVILAGNGDFNVKLYRGKFEAYQRTYVLSPECTEYLYLLYHAVNNSMVKLAQGASGSTIKFLTKGMIASIPVYTPEVKNLEKFNTLSEAIQKQIEVLKKSIANATEARNRLLPKLMSGEIEV